MFLALGKHAAEMLPFSIHQIERTVRKHHSIAFFISLPSLKKPNFFLKVGTLDWPTTEFRFKPSLMEDYSDFARLVSVIR